MVDCRPFGAGALLVGIGLVASGCVVVNDADDHQKGDAGSSLAPVPASQFCDALAEVLCDAHLECCSTTNIERDECISQTSSNCAMQFGSLTTDSRTGYDPQVAADVLEEGRSFIDDCSTDVTAWVASRSGFQRVLTGTVEGGDECTPRSSSDIAAYFSCIDREQACTRVTSDRWICSSLKEEGDSCNSDFGCREGLFCKGSTLFSAGTCTERKSNGETCMDDGDCQSLVCDNPTSAAGTCVHPEQDAIYCSVVDGG